MLKLSIYTQKQNKISVNNEIIVSIFAVLLTIISTYFTYNNQLEKNLNLSLWITNGLVLLSLFFYYFIECSIKKFTNYIPCLKIIAPFIFWALLIYLPIFIVLSFCLFALITLYTRKSFSYQRLFSKSNIYISILYFVVIGSEVWNMHRIPLPDHYLITQSQTGNDLSFFSAVTSMLKTYNLCSIGIDGLNEFPYHYGTYYLFSKVSIILNLNSLYINHIIAPLILLPIALYVILETLAIFKKYLSEFFGLFSITLRIRDHIILASILTTLTNAPFGLPFVANLSFFTSPFQIDSQLLANLFIGLILLITLKSSFACNKNLIVSLFILLILQTSLSFIKSPASHLSLFLVLYTCFRYSVKRTLFQNQLWFIFSILISASTFYTSYLLVPSMVNQEGIISIGFFELWKNYIPVREWQWIYLSNGFYTFSSITISAFILKKVSAFDFFVKIKESQFSLLEVVSVLSFTAISLTAVFDGALSFASTYYLDSIKFISLILLVSCISIFFSKTNLCDFHLVKFLRSNSLIRVISILGLVFILITGVGISLKGWERNIDKHLDSNLAIHADNEKIQRKLDILKSLLSLSKLQKEKSETCLWIPKSNTIFWDELPLPENEAFLPFWAVSLSEMALIDGYPITNKLNGMFGYNSYNPKTFHDNTTKKDLSDIMNDAENKGFKYLIVLWDHENYDIHTL